MKKLLVLLFLLGIISTSYVIYKYINEKNYYKNEVEKILDKIDIEVEDNIILNDLYIYGNHLNIDGNILNNNIKNIELVIKSYDTEIIPLILTKNDDKINFKISSEINNGLILDDYNNAIYVLFLKITNYDNSVNYYSINYSEELIYYTITNDLKENYKIIINNDNQFNTISFKSTLTNEETYDIILDPGHGGRDSGACLYKNKTCERDYTPIISKKIKEKLETYNIKVAYTWDIDNIKNSEIIPNYGEKSRTGRTYETHAKYLISIHLNSSSSRKGSGFEIYTPYNINYEFANLLKNNFSKITNYSSNSSFRVSDGIYTRTFTTYDLEDIKKVREKNNLEPLNVSNKTNYYFMIRETSGKIGGAYVDGTTHEDGSNNIYRNSSVTSEGYIIELGYISNKKDVEHVNDNLDLYVDAIVNSIIEYLGK